MLTLLTYPANFGQSSLSPFCVKAEYLLNMSGQSWQREDTNDPRNAPRGKLPVLRTPEGLVHDSDYIKTYLENKGADFDGHLSPKDLVTAHALRRMVEEHMYFTLVLDRWERDTVWPTIRETYFFEIPKILRSLIAGGLRKGLLKGMNVQGLGRLTWDERMERVEKDLDCIRAQLGDKPFLFGDKPTSFDASTASMLGAARSTPVETTLSKRVSQDALLCAYVDRAAEAMG